MDAAKADAHSLRTLGLLWHFGRFIQNTDMHVGNLSFVPVDGHFQMAPAYDMLPMHHAPVRGVELPQRACQVSLPTPDPFEMARPAAQAAHGLWVQASQASASAKGSGRCARAMPRRWGL